MQNLVCIRMANPITEVGFVMLYVFMQQDMSPLWKHLLVGDVSADVVSNGSYGQYYLSGFTECVT